MDINELESFKLSDAVKFHDNLNPALWTEKGELDPEVKAKLMEIARDFIAELGISTLKVEDITISGSNAAYTYTPHSDLDLHILVDFTKLPDDEVYQELFNAKKTLYNDTHDIKVHGVPVELYVQDSNQPVVSLGEYSLLKNEWLKIPKKRKANFDQSATRLKYEKLGSLIELALKQKDVKKIDQVLKTIKRYRKAGLDTTGEFGPENLAFKALRSQGYIQKLYDLKNELHAKELSLQEKINPEIMNKDFDVKKIIEIPKVGKLTLHAYYLSDHILPQFKVDVITPDGKKVGYFRFIVHDYEPDKKIFGFKVKSKLDPYVLAGNVSVWDEYQKKGIATAVYQFVKELGNDIKPSTSQTAAGKAMWKSFNRPTDEDYDPNGPPPGPEFKPTMPKGTVRVDVSDVYDWYKLGQHISNLKGLGKHDFGKGPPSTILSFGDEDTEHKYIQDLEKTGLTTTDIDPVDPNQPKGMKRQKVDPTFNVNEESGKKSAIYSTDVYGMTAYHSKCLEPGCDWESKRYDSIKLAQNAAQKHAQKHFKKGVAEGYSNTTFNVDRRKLNVPALIQKGAIFVTYPHGEQGWETDNKEDWAFSLLSLYNVLQGGWPNEAKKYLKPESYRRAEQQINSSAPNLGSDKLVYDGKYNQILWSIKKLGIPDNVAFLDKDKQGMAEASGYIPSEKEKNDPRFKTALTKDVRPDSIKKNAKAFGFNVTRAGIPPLLRK